MKKKIISIILIVSSILATSGCAILPKQSGTVDADYGWYPENHEEIVYNWMKQTLPDPYTVLDLTIGSPTKSRIKKTSMFGWSRTMYGYTVPVTFNAKDKRGVYAGVTTAYLLIHKGVVVFCEGDKSDRAYKARYKK